MSDLITRKPTALMTELLRRGAADKRGIMTLADHNDRTQDGILRRDMAEVVHEDGATHSWLVINDKGRAYVAKLEAAEKGKQEAVSAPQAAEERPVLPPVPESAAPRSMAEAIDIIARLKTGDRVRVTNPQGRTNDLTVSRMPRRSDGAFGSPESLGVTVTFGPGRYSFEVRAGDLFAQQAGKYTTYGGTRIMLLTAEGAAPRAEERPVAVDVMRAEAESVSAVSAAFAARVRGEERPQEPDMAAMSEAEHASAFGERFARVRRARMEGERVFGLEVSVRVVSYRAESCAFVGEEDHECESECTWLEGDSRELEDRGTDRFEADSDDLEAFEGDAVAWAADYIRSKTDAVNPSVSPVGEELGEHEWLSGSSEDPYQGDSRVTETTVRLVGDWTPQERARVFRAVMA